MSTVRYTPLQSPHHIRVLDLEPGTGSDPIACRLSTVSLLDNPVYEALSYTWGDPNEPKGFIVCNGDSTPVMNNLKAAFRRLRLPNDIRSIWADAICIHQNDISERNAQVQLMSHIYRKASRVVVWLGEETAESVREIQMLKKLASAYELRVKSYAPDQYRSATPSELQSYGLPGLDDPAWQDIKRLYYRPWFGRVWVQQEVGLARTTIVICGSYVEDWNLYAITALFLESTQIGHEIGSGGHGSVVRMHSFHTHTTHKETGDTDGFNSYFAIIQGNRNSGCTDPRDKIYGILGIIDEPGEKFTDIDYSSSIPDVYIKFTFFLINKEKSLRILNTRLDISQQSIPGLPTWCTDWTSQCLVRQLTLQKIAPRQASGDTKASVRPIGDNNNILAVKGSIVDRVTDVGSYFGGFGVRAAEVRIPEDWDSIAAACDPYPTGEPIYDAWWKTLLAGQVPADEDLPRSLFFCWYNCYSRGGRTNPIPLPLDEDAVITHAHNFAQRAAAASRETTFFATQKGFMGTGHASTDVGDIVVVLHGGPTPYLLRPTIDPKRFSGYYYHPSLPLVTFKDEVYLFIGECYVHGIMQGEAIKDGTLPFEEFCIR